MRLSPTAPVIGLFEEWRCEVCDVDLGPGDTLAIFSDGVVEAFDASGVEFGEERLEHLLRQHGPLASQALVNTVVGEVQRHSGPTPSDDFTLILARVQERPARQPAPSKKVTKPDSSEYSAPTTSNPSF